MSPAARIDHDAVASPAHEIDIAIEVRGEARAETAAAEEEHPIAQLHVVILQSRERRS